MTWNTGADQRHDGVKELVVTGAWSAESRALVEAGEVDRLVLNHALGFDEPSLDFLEGLPVRELVVLDRRQTSLTPVLSLAGTLRSLQVTTDLRAKLDLTGFTQLTGLAADWSQVNDTIHEASSLSRAYLRGYGARDLTPLAALTRLRELEMKDRPGLRSLEGLAVLTSLSSLAIYLARDLSDIAALAGRFDLERLVLEACRRVESLDALSGCVSLRELNLSDDGDIASFEPIRMLSRLVCLGLHTCVCRADARTARAWRRSRHLCLEASPCDGDRPIAPQRGGRHTQETIAAVASQGD